jgi:hypothetical protein
MEFNSLKFENLFLPEQFHYIRQVLSDVSEEEILNAFIEQFEIKFIKENQLVLFQCSGS